MEFFMVFFEQNKSWIYSLISILLGVLMLGMYFSPLNISSDTSNSTINIRTLGPIIPTLFPTNSLLTTSPSSSSSSN